MRKWWLVLLLGLVPVGCGGHSGPNPKLVNVCSGLTDQCHEVPVATLSKRARLRPFPGCRVVDVSDYQRYIDWAKVKPYVCGAIDKAGEGNGYGGGSYFVHNWTQQRQLGLWHAAYWFQRGHDGCAQFDLFMRRLQSVGYAQDKTAGPPQDDEEDGSNLTLCFEAATHRYFAREGGVYTGPGTWGGGSHDAAPLWQAEYGPTLHPVWSPVVLWQCTDGRYGCVSYVPGIGYDDVSADRGITGYRPPPPPPDPYAIYPKARFHLAQGQTASEHNTVAAWYGEHCKHPARRQACKSSQYHAELLRDRVWFIAHHRLDHGHWVSVRRPRWAADDLGARFQGLTKIAR